MTQVEFDTQVKRLVDTYGEKAFPAERVRIMWGHVSGYDRDWFRRLCDKLIASCRQAPVYADYAEDVNHERDRIWTAQKHSRKVVEMRDWACSTCHGLGAVLARKIDGGAAYAFKCSCGAGKADRRAFPHWRDEYQESYRVV